MNRIFSILQSFLQSLLLCIPKLSEGRIAVSKTMAFLKAWHYIARARIEGDYFEFGVFEGMSFNLSLGASKKFKDSDPYYASRRFFALDSFEGLPEPDAKRDAQIFKKGEYCAGEELFLRNTASRARGRDVRSIRGRFGDLDAAQIRKDHQWGKAAFVAIDCDLYQSALDALRMITPCLQTGTVIYFDDWFCSGGDMNLGEAGATRAWLAENPKIKLIEYGLVGTIGKMVIVNIDS